MTMPELPLRDIHLPDAISWWPPALGWWLLLAVLLLFLFGFVMIIRQWVRTTLRKEALKAFDRIEKSFYASENGAQCLADVSLLLRRVCLSRNLARSAAGVTGKAWLELLDKSLKKPEFSKGIGRLLLTGPYRPHVQQTEVAELLKLCRKWMERL
jgi:hypothetical protein